MKEELYKYAISIKNSDNQKVNFADVGTFILLGIFSLPMLLLNILLFLQNNLKTIIFFSWQLNLIVIKLMVWNLKSIMI